MKEKMMKIKLAKYDEGRQKCAHKVYYCQKLFSTKQIQLARRISRKTNFNLLISTFYSPLGNGVANHVFLWSRRTQRRRAYEALEWKNKLLHCSRPEQVERDSPQFSHLPATEANCRTFASLSLNYPSSSKAPVR